MFSSARLSSSTTLPRHELTAMERAPTKIAGDNEDGGN